MRMRVRVDPEPGYDARAVGTAPGSKRVGDATEGQLDDTSVAVRTRWYEMVLVLPPLVVADGKVAAGRQRATKAAAARIIGNVALALGIMIAFRRFGGSFRAGPDNFYHGSKCLCWSILAGLLLARKEV